MNIDLTGKIALVTGSNVGIGRAIAIALAESGAKVGVNCLRSVDQGEETVAAIRAAGGEAVLVQADVTDLAQIDRLVSEVERAFGGSIDILVNNAGHLVQRVDNAGMTEEIYEKIMNVNLKSTVFMCKRVLAGMKAKGAGRIINMTSIAAHNGGGPGASLYAASKAAIMAYSKGLAKEVAFSGITVNNVSPGFIGNTRFHDTFTTDEARKATVAGIPLKREGTPEDVAGAVLYLVSDLASYVTGETIEINGGLLMR
ncbi:MULTISPECIES: SDR family NAD(P)-dependent oxidoreductase [Paenibacillus]|uniref:3-ketoacyl-ACP reductase n=1 Tax=Paenibacillus naphthalenovorans TaxID=162209 RepID=A0A0U2VYZ2_9BACL|nr:MULTISPECIES: 3-oxoacyl-ACP reductase family protein [Paenibacillus]ALS21492.1 3-ketoacyl-ACP reductase [Paenibacillus naphthalenovorans]NTZ18347.1 3-oxoacyl-ACP reductase FabG [Paenibacillus sp. JMULE4]GCL71218.1 3-oxoacyl-ACP reductase FabG [Paenibacillus naphthalenovorans]SDI76826.1 3-oxoacyl-[acyl-carrier protein] reductase [Paenibacillus naphthalenovorans]